MPKLPPCLSISTYYTQLSQMVWVRAVGPKALSPWQQSSFLWAHLTFVGAKDRNVGASQKNVGAKDRFPLLYHCSSKGTFVPLAGHYCATSRHFVCIRFFKNELRKYPSPFIYPSESPVFIGVSGAEWHNFTLHHPSLPFIFSHFFLQIWR